LACLGGLGCAPAARIAPAPPPELPVTRAEASGYGETSSHADVVAFLAALRAADRDSVFSFGVLGTTADGRSIPVVIASRPGVRTPDDARRLGQPLVFVQGNIHGGEVEGKEALQILLRELAFGRRPNALDSVVLMAVPLYNADGNEALGAQERNRPEQNGPAVVGRRANGMGLDLNRDYMKVEAPETGASLRLFNEWDPDVFVDLHTTNGSLHGYALTYSPPLAPAAPLEAFTRDLLDTLRDRTRARHGFETFEYGNFGTDDTPWQQRAVHTPAVNAWSTFDSRPRFSTNYYGLRDAVGILAEGYSHDPFDQRIAVMKAFVSEILSLAGERGAEIISARDEARRQFGPLRSPEGHALPVRARFTTAPDTGVVLVETVERMDPAVRDEPGLAPGLRRTGRLQEAEMPLYTRFEPTLTVRVPEAYVIPAHFPAVVERLRTHGIEVTEISEPFISAGLERFVIDSLSRAARVFEGHHEVRAFGRWTADSLAIPFGDFIVSTQQTLGRLAVYLLEPESDDGLVNWNFFDDELVPGGDYPVRRVHGIAAPD
jgi:murein tripeptide amidase MpaA